MTELNSAPAPSRNRLYAVLRTGVVLAGVLVLAAGCVAEPGYYDSGQAYSPGYGGGTMYYGGGGSYDRNRNRPDNRPGWSGNARPTPPRYVAPRPGRGNYQGERPPLGTPFLPTEDEREHGGN